MTLYLGDNKINMILHPSIKDTKQDKQSWTDGTQASVTPAGFHDCGFRYYSEYNRKIQASEQQTWNGDQTSNWQKMANGLLGCTLYLNNKTKYVSDDNKSTVEEYMTKESLTIGACFFIDLIPLKDTTNLDGFYQLKYVASMGASDISIFTDEDKITQQPDSEHVHWDDIGSFVIIGAVCIDYDDNGNIESVRPLSAAYQPKFMWTTLFTYENEGVTDYVYYNAGKTAIKMVGVVINASYTWIIDYLTFNINTYNLPASDQTSGTVAAAKSDYEAITTELTARGNTITSLNTQGQNLVTKHNTLVDKYNNIISQWDTNKED